MEPGVTFCPSERDLTDVYLRRKIAGEDLPANTGRYIHVADVYSAEPEKLTDKFDEAPGTGKGGVHKQPEWYFFSPVRYVGGRKTNAHGGVGRKSRRIVGEAGKHWWHSEKGEMPVKGGSEYGGYEQYFSYKVKNASSGKEERARWIMTDYGISPEHGGGDLVLCKIHRSPRNKLEDEVLPVSDPIVSSKKRKAATGDHREDRRERARPRRTVDQDEHHPQPASTVEDAMTPEDTAAQHRYTAAEIIFDEDPETEIRMKFPLLFPMTPEDAASDQAAPPRTFFQNVQRDFRSLYKNNMVVPIGDLAVPPCAPAAQPVDAAATGLVQTINAYEVVPHQNYNDESQMEASFGEEQPEPDKTAAGEVIYGLPCPAFSSEMTGRCSNDVPMPWRSTSSMPMPSGLF